MKKLLITLGCFLLSTAAFADSIVLQPGESRHITTDMLVMSLNILSGGHAGVTVHCAAPQVAYVPGYPPAYVVPQKPLYGIRRLENTDWELYNQDTGAHITTFLFEHQAQSALRDAIRTGQCRNTMHF